MDGKRRPGDHADRTMPETVWSRHRSSLLWAALFQSFGKEHARL